MRTLAEGRWAASGSNDTYSAQFHVAESWSSVASTTNLTGVSVSNTFYGTSKSSDSSSFTVVADAAHPVEIRFDAAVSNFIGTGSGGDRWQAQIFKEGTLTPVAELTGQTGSLANKVIGGITESGTYYVRFTVFDNTDIGSGNSSRADLTISDFFYRSYSYTAPSTQQVNVSAPGVLWVAALLSGNVLGNDDPGSDGGLRVTLVDGAAVAAGGSVELVGDYGTLHIESNGQYTYTQHQQDFQAGASDSFAYSIVDADGSPSSAVLTINLTDHNYSSTSSSGNDFVGGEDANNTLSGRGGNDIVYGGAGNDTLNGNTGSDHLIGGSGDDILYGNDNNDILEGGLGNDQLYGGTGNDALLGGVGNDTLIGDAGSDILIGGLGSDIMTGGADKDAYVWRAGDEDAGVDTVVGFFVDTNGISSDMLDLSQLLTGLSGTPDGNELDDYLTFDFTTTAGSTVITVDKNGADGGGSSDQTIVLDNVDLSTYYGSNAADVINGMLDDNALKVA